MELATHTRPLLAGKPILLCILLGGFIALLTACQEPEKLAPLLSGPPPSEHTLLVITPGFAVRTSGDTLHKSYLRLRTGKTFPLTGILRVDGKAYRFMGADSLRISPLASLANDSTGWLGKYSYLYPGKGWEQPVYDDSSWSRGESAFGLLTGKYPARTAWGSNNIYVRRHISLDDKDALKGRKLYIRYICDDDMTFYCNGNYCFKKSFTPQLKCLQLPDEVAAKIRQGDNVLAAYVRNTGGSALLDFGLYVENKTYSEADTATLKRMDVQATQTHYIFQCGEAELQLDFVSPSLSEKWNMAGWPAGFLAYQVRTKTRRQPEIEIQFDVDTEWMSGSSEAESWVENGWRFVKSDSLYISMMAEETVASSEEGHVLLSQKLCAKNGNKGVLLLGYAERPALQYDGETLLPLWNRDGKGEMKELLKSVGSRYRDIQEELDKLDNKWRLRLMRTGNKMLARQMLLSYRDFISSHRLVMSSEGSLFCFADTLGNVREAYESFPSLRAFNRVDWMKGLLNPIFTYCENPCYTKKYPPYDIGLYPVANKQEKVEACSEEAAANMLMMTAMIVETEQDFSYAAAHWELLCRWAEFLRGRMDKGRLPAGELLSKDDKRVKCALGWMAFRRLVEMKEEYE